MLQTVVKSLNLIVSYDAETGGIASDGIRPWFIPEDIALFRGLTTGTQENNTTNAIIMGHRTWLNLPRCPLDNRINIILSRAAYNFFPENPTDSEPIWCPSMEKAIRWCREHPLIGDIFIIGGGEIYQEALSNYIFDNIYVTEIYNAYKNEYDVYFPIIPNNYYVTENTARDGFSFVTYRPNPEINEQCYLNLCRSILNDGNVRGDRTGVGTVSTFAPKALNFDLNGQIPVLTTKWVAWNTLVKELLWFISGSTDANVLRRQGCHIWNGNSTRAFLDKPVPGQRGPLTQFEEGDIGAGYGFQWRHFGAQYKGMNADYDASGFDQLKYIVEEIRTNPNSRRILMSSWNPSDLCKMALPPCHVMVQFYVQDGLLSTQMYQRSADVFLGLPFNIASYSLLTHMIAHVTGLQANRLTIVLGDAHIYTNHIEQVKQQLDRSQYTFPELILNPEVKELTDFKFEDIQLKNYRYHPTIKAPMAV